MTVLRQDAELAWLDWGVPTGKPLPRYKTYFSAEDTGTTGLLQGTLVYPPGSSVVPHWHTPIETYFVLEGEGLACLDGQKIRLGPGSGIYVPSRAIHWFENVGDAPWTVFWTLACSAMADLDFTPTEA